MSQQKGAYHVIAATQTIGFLQALYGDKPDGLYVLIWTLQGKKSAWFQNLDDAALYATEQATSRDVYVGVGLAPRNYGPGLRCPANDVSGIVGLWADIDVADPVHRKPNLPPTQEDAEILLDSMGIQPTVLLHSGHGLQAWWLFKEPWLFDGPEERAEAASLSERWIKTLKARASQRGWDVDSTHDLARVLRVAGTVNRKSTPAPVTVIRESGARYDPGDFDSFLLDVVQPARPSSVVRASDLQMDANAGPPFDKWEALQAAEPKVVQTWNRTRRDLQDQSASSYDMALANFCVMAGWSDQEVTNLLVAHRRKHGDDLKRPDYYARTIAKAREGHQRAEAQERLEEVVTEIRESEATHEDRAARRESITSALSALFGVRIERVVRYLSDPPAFKLETSRGSISLGGIEGIMNQQTFRQRLAAAAGVVIPAVKGPKWDERAQALLDACEEESIGAEATDAGMCHAWLGAYLQERRPLEDKGEALRLDYPFLHDGAVHIVGAGFRKWLGVNQGERVSAKEMGSILRSGGCSAEVIGVSDGEARTTRSVWRLPNQYR